MKQKQDPNWGDPDKSLCRNAESNDEHPAPPTARRERGSEGEHALLQLVSALLAQWKLVLGLPFGAAFLVAVVSLILPSMYTARASFVPERGPDASSVPAGLAGLASQFGVTSVDGLDSPEFYADVLGSRTLRDQVLLARFADPRTAAATDSTVLLDILRIKGETQLERLERGREELSDAVSVRVDNMTSIVSVAVESRYPALSADAANFLIELLSRFNLATRRYNVAESRRFIEGRVREAENELQQVEGTLQVFLEQNRSFEGSPELDFQHDRLVARVSVRREVVSSLRRQYEDFRIQEVNNTPVLTVIDTAVPPQRRSSPKRRLNVILSFILGGMLGVVGAFGRESVARIRETDPDEFKNLVSQWAGIRSQIRFWSRRSHRAQSSG